MALQLSINEMKGTLGNLTYYKSKDGFRVKRKSSVSKTKILTSVGNAGTRQNMAEFKNAGIAARVFREGIRPMLAIAKDTKMISRFVRLMKKVALTDTTNTRGNRNVTKGALELLNGFDFNIDGKLGANFYAPYTTNIDRVAGTLKIDIPAFQPNTMVPPPQGATHFKIFSAGSEVDFLKEQNTTDIKQTAELPCDNNLTAAISHVHTATPNSTLPLFLLLGLQFYQMVNGELYPLLNKTKNPLAIIAVNKGS